MIKTSFNITDYTAYSLEDVKSYGLIDISDRDDQIEKMIKSSVMRLSAFSSIAFAPMTVTAYIDNRNGEESYLPFSNGALPTLPDGFTLIGVDGDYLVSGDGTGSFTYDVTPTIQEWMVAAVKQDVMFFFENGGEYSGSISKEALSTISPFLNMFI